MSAIPTEFLDAVTSAIHDEIINARRFKGDEAWGATICLKSLAYMLSDRLEALDPDFDRKVFLSASIGV